MKKGVKNAKEREKRYLTTKKHGKGLRLKSEECKGQKGIGHEFHGLEKTVRTV